MSEQVVRLFVSSPGDVAEERLRVERVVERLNVEFRGRVRVETIRWEAAYYSAHETFQHQIPEAATCDLVVAIFRGRLGTALPRSFPRTLQGEPYPSGTAYEILSAIESRREGRPLPDIYVFRYPRAPLIALDAPDRDEIETQWQRLRRFFETWFQTETGEFLAAFQDYDGLDTFARKLEDCLRQWLARHGYVAGAGIWDRLRFGSPYPGLDSFGPERSVVFCGRDAAIERALRRLRDSVSSGLPVLLVAGASGTGKSSLIRAGLLPRIVQPGFLPEVDGWRPASFRPGPDPVSAFAEALLVPEALGPDLADGVFASTGTLARQMRAFPEAVPDLLVDALRRSDGAGADGDLRLLITVDQLERLFEEAPADAPLLAELLLGLARTGRAVIVLALRSDTYSSFQGIPAFVTLREQGGMVDLLPPDAGELEDIVRLPASRCEPPLVFEEQDGRSLARVLVAEAQGGDALPLLQMALSRLDAAQARRGDGVLRFADHEGLGEAVARTAEEALSGLPDAVRAELPALVAALVRDVAADPVTGALVPLPAAFDRTAFEGSNPARRILVQRFVENRLLASAEEGGHVRVRAVHEALLRIWPQARAILVDLAGSVRVRRALEPLVRAWQEAEDRDRPGHLVLSAALVEGARGLSGRFGSDLPADMRAFIDAALGADAARRQAEENERDRRVRDAEALAAAEVRTRRLVVGALVLTLLLGAGAAWQWHAAQVQRDRAERSLALATGTANALVTDLAVRFRNVVGVPTDAVKQMLDRARRLQDELLGAGEGDPALRASRAAAGVEVSRTLLDLGDSTGARQAAETSRALFSELAAQPDDRTGARAGLASAHMALGEIALLQGRLDDSVQAFRSALELRAVTSGGGYQARPGTTPSVAAEALDRISEVQLARGALTEAREAATQGLELRLATGAPAAGQADVALSQERVGNAELALGRLPDSLDRFDRALRVWQALATAEPDNARWLERAAILSLKTGDILGKQGRPADALVRYQDSLAARRRLAGSDPARVPWQLALSVAAERVGTMAARLGRPQDALAAQQDSLAIRRRLAAADPANAATRRDLSVALNLNADALRAAGRAGEAVDLARESVALMEGLVATGPSHVGWHSDLFWARWKLGAALDAAGRPDEALVAYRAAEEAAATALSLSPQAPDRLRERALAWRTVADLQVRLGAAAEAKAAYEQSLAALTALTRLDTSNAEWRAELTDALGGMAYNLVFLRDFEKALEAADLSIAQNPDLRWLSLNRAHALMFLGRAEECLRVHRENRGRPTFGTRPWEAAVAQNFAQLRAAGLDHPLMATVEASFRDPP